METAHRLPPHTAGFVQPPRSVLHFDIQPGMQIADFGAGSGHYIWPMSELAGEKGNVFAVDVQQDLLKRIHNEARRRGFNNVKMVWADLEKPKASKLGDRTIDLVLISNLLFQLEEKRTALREAKRILHPGGTLALIDWADSYDSMGPHKKSVVTKDAGASLVRECGFEIRREFSAGAHHWGLIARPSV